MKRKLFAALLAAAMLMSVMTGCGNTGEGSGSSGGSGTGGSSSDNSSAESAYTKPTGDVDLQVWYAVSGVTGETFEAKVKAYQEANPNIHIELSYAGSYADAAEKISANLMTGTAPDVALIAAGPLYTGGRGDFTMESLIEDPSFGKDDIYDGVWDYAMFDGRICAIPYGISVPVLYYNKAITDAAGIDMETEAPETWDELYALAERAQRDGNINNSSTFYGFETSDAPWLFKSMLNQNGNTIINTDDGEITPVYNDESAVEVAEFWQKLAANGVMPVGEHSNAENTFLAGNCAFIVASSVRLARWSADPVVDFGVLPMPSFTQDSVALGGNVLVTFSEDADKLAASWDLIKYLTNAENHTEFSLATGYLPIHESAMDMDITKTAFEEDPRREIVFSQLENAWSYWHFDAMGTMDVILGDMLSDLEGGSDVQTTLDDGVDELLREM